MLTAHKFSRGKRFEFCQHRSGRVRVLLFCALLSVGSSLSLVAQVAPSTPAPGPALAAQLLPIGERASAPQPFQPALWFGGTLVPALLLWVALASWRAERSEATYTQRRARRALGKLVRRLQSSRQVPTAVELERWSALTAELFAVPRAAPTARDLVLRMQAHTTPASKVAWTILWHEAQAALFAVQRPVPADWPTRAAQVWEQTEITRVASRLPHRRQHWLPLAAVITVASLVGSVNEARAADAGEAWARGDFFAARQEWKAHLREQPGDWAAQHDVALSYQQQDLWGPATAHWTAAFLLNPRENLIADAMQKVVEKMDGIDPTLRRVVAGKWYERSAALLSPAEWQQLMKLCAGLLALGLSVGVVGLYRDGVVWRGLAGGMVCLGLAGFALGTNAVWRYGVLANPAAACITRASDLRSVPSELVEQEKTAPLLAGQIVTINGYYFGWCRITVRSGAPGWVRREAVLPLYTAQKERGATGFPAPAGTR